MTCGTENRVACSPLGPRYWITPMVPQTRQPLLPKLVSFSSKRALVVVSTSLYSFRERLDMLDVTEGPPDVVVVRAQQIILRCRSHLDVENALAHEPTHG